MSFPGAADPSQLNKSVANLLGRKDAMACGLPKGDPSFPCTDGTIGVPPIWTSDYTFKGIFNWLTAVNAP